jgi:hypothetical protein
MISSWEKFNENTDELRSHLGAKLTEVRDVFTDFEDMGIITYTVVASGFERSGYTSFDPKRGDFERFIDYITPVASLGISVHGLGNKTSEEDFCIITDIKLPGESTEFGSTVIGNEGIKIFEDILVANSRLIDAGYNVKLDLNASHGQYKPVKFLIYL